MQKANSLGGSEEDDEDFKVQMDGKEIKVHPNFKC